MLHLIRESLRIFCFFVHLCIIWKIVGMAVCPQHEYFRPEKYRTKFLNDQDANFWIVSSDANC